MARSASLAVAPWRPSPGLMVAAVMLLVLGEPGISGPLAASGAAFVPSPMPHLIDEYALSPLLPLGDDAAIGPSIASTASDRPAAAASMLGPALTATPASLPAAASAAAEAGVTPAPAADGAPAAAQSAAARAALAAAASDPQPAAGLMTGALSSVDEATLSAEWTWLASVSGKADVPQLWSGAFQPPVKGIVTSDFGAIRSDEGLPASPHEGVDIAAPAGTPVVAANDGVVVFTGPLAVRGNAVVVDHGNGVFSGYYHLSRIDVASGQAVVGGAVLGAVGGTGLATGPHVHWDMIVLGQHTPPLDWIGKTAVPFPSDHGVLVFSSGPAKVAAGGPAYPTRIDLTSPEAIESAIAARNAASVGEAAAAPDPGSAAGAAATPATDPTAAPASAPPASNSQSDAAARDARAAAIRQLYRDMLGRPADPAGLDTWLNSGLTPDAIKHKLGIEAQVEREQRVRQIYLDMLGRDPTGVDESSLSSWASGDLTLDELRTAIARAGAAERAARIRDLYLQLLGRDPGEADKGSLDAWVNSSLALDEIQRRIMSTPEYAARSKP